MLRWLDYRNRQLWGTTRMHQQNNALSWTSLSISINYYDIHDPELAIILVAAVSDRLSIIDYSLA